MGFVSKKDIAKALALHTIEAVKAVSSMEAGQFAFSGLSASRIRKSLSQKIDFEKLYEEFSVTDSQGHYFKNAVDKAIIPTDIDNLFILPSGAVPPNPSELAGSERTRFLIEFLEGAFDFIIIDTPPVMPTTDALLLAPRTDGTIMVIRSGHTDRKIIKDVLEQYEKARQPVIGTVLTTGSTCTRKDITGIIKNTIPPTMDSSSSRLNTILRI